MNLQIGDKVEIPKTKSVGAPYHLSTHIMNAQNMGQDFLYFNGYLNGSYEWVKLTYYETEDRSKGDYFLASELEPYVRYKKIVINDGNYRYIISGPAVICFITENDKIFKGIAKCIPEDTFDLEKGKDIARLKAELKQDTWNMKLKERKLKELTK